MPSIIAPPKRVNLIPAGIAAGIIGGALLDLFMVLQGAKPLGIYQWVASNVVGPVAFTSTSYAVLGAAIHFAVSIVWGIVYAALAQSGRPALVNRPVPSGLLYGFVVMLAMLTVQVFARTYVSPNHDWPKFFMSLIAHTVLFGVAIALVVSAAARKALRT
ncbi:MAG TPA: hypothetical protein VNJ51_10570 [Candidatus Dormibacteraeota bacterium]|nr:hypothetical protein [Candidatus Dormibacteraeota bacterium]